MSFEVQLGLIFAAATAATSVLGFLYKHRGAVEAPHVEFRRPVYSTFMLFRSGWYSIGIAVAFVSWCLHVAALSLAPISLVQSVIAGGLVLLTVLAERVFNHEVRRREWVGVGLAACGLAFLAATIEGQAQGPHSSFDAAGIATYIGLTFGAGVAVAAIGIRPATRTGRRLRQHAGVLLGVAAGLMWGASDIAIKGASADIGDGLALVTEPLVWVVIIASLVGLLVSARSLQLGEAVPVIAVTSVTANVTTIASGPVVFGDSMPDDPLGLAARISAFVMVIAAAAMTPMPTPEALPAELAAEAGERPESERESDRSDRDRATV